MWRYVIPMAPLGQPRHRGHGKKSDKEKAWRKEATWHLNIVRRDPPRIAQHVPVRVTVLSFKARPKSLGGDPGPRACPVTPDADNVAKIILDVLGKLTDARGAPIVWHDDAQIVDLNPRKFYCAVGGTPRVEVKIEVIEDELAWVAEALG